MSVLTNDACLLMKTYIWIAFFSLFVGYASAQEKGLPVRGDSLSAAARVENDSLSVPLAAPVPAFDAALFSMYGMSPYGYGYMNWELHEGFNASIGMNVTFSPDKYAPSGVGFGQNAAFMYAVPLTERFSVAGGIYASNFNWGTFSCRNVGFAGVAAFKVNDRISVYAYGNKSFMPRRPLPYYPLPAFAPDRLGGMVNFKLGESASISVGVEGIRQSDVYYWR